MRRLGSLGLLVLPIIGPIVIPPGSGGTTPPGSTTTTTPTTTTTTTTTSPPPPAQHVPSGNPFAGRAMWIWELWQTDSGNLGQVVAQAQAAGISTVFVKSSDGSTPWGQWGSTLVSALHAGGLRVCAWQYVYGVHPLTEADLGAAAVSDGADCLVIDAESEYQNRYVQAQQYVLALRNLIGQSFPVGLAGLPYVDYHPGFPYSIFLGPGGAQYNLPQMYWKDIGTSVDNVYAHTYRFNTIFVRPIFPIGQLYSSPRASDVLRFRQLAIAYGATGISWWDWQEAATGQFTLIAQPLAALAGFTPSSSVAAIGLHAKGDLVVWAQEHLVSAGYRVTVDGGFGPGTQLAVEQFQSAKGLPITGVVDAGTWYYLLRYQPAFVHWWLHVPKPKPTPKSTSKKTTPTSGATVAAKASRDAPRQAPAVDAVVPRPLPAVRDELAGHPGRGR
jgi:hypothetical protein